MSDDLLDIMFDDKVLHPLGVFKLSSTEAIPIIYSKRKKWENAEHL